MDTLVIQPITSAISALPGVRLVSVQVSQTVCLAKPMQAAINSTSISEPLHAGRLVLKGSLSTLTSTMSANLVLSNVQNVLIILTSAPKLVPIQTNVISTTTS